MVERRLKVNNKFGLHARPASKIMNIASKYNSEIFLYKLNEDDKKADCKSVLSLLLLGAVQGTELILCTSGQDEEISINDISNLFDRNFDEDF